MNRFLQSALALGIAAAVASGAAIAQKPEWAGKGNGGGGKVSAKGNGNGGGKSPGKSATNRPNKAKATRTHFNDQHRSYVRSYYDDEFRGGHCPPGLRKKNNGCMPPGQAKKWRMGQPLPAAVVVYDIPPRLEIRLGLPPAGYKYVRVASDILMIAVGTRMVVDAINDLGRL